MNDRYTPFHVCEENTDIVRDEENFWFASTYGGDKVERAERARRIVACMNALEHVSTEQLESGEFRHTIEDLTKQRDELIAAMRKAADEIRKCDYTPARSTLLTSIANVKGVTNGPNAE